MVTGRNSCTPSAEHRMIICGKPMSKMTRCNVCGALDHPGALSLFSAAVIFAAIQQGLTKESSPHDLMISSSLTVKIGTSQLLQHRMHTHVARCKCHIVLMHHAAAVQRYITR